MSFAIIYPMIAFIGTIEFCIAGCLANIREGSTVRAPLSGILTAFGGGFFIRDLVLLNTTPGALLENDQLIFASLLAIHFCFLCCCYPYRIEAAMSVRSTKAAFTLIDAAACAVYAADGFLKARAFGANVVCCVFAAAASSCGGGILAAIFMRDIDLLIVAASAIPFRATLLLNGIGMAHILRHESEMTARNILFWTISIPCVLLDADIRSILHDRAIAGVDAYRCFSDSMLMNLLAAVQEAVLRIPAVLRQRAVSYAAKGVRAFRVCSHRVQAIATA